MPNTFSALEVLLKEMPFHLANGASGLLAKGQLADATKDIPNYTSDIKGIDASHLLTALFRDYTFWASAYLLEPCHLNMLKTGEYGLGRDRLPQNIAEPLCLLAQKLGVKPFMEYALSYALMNWKKKKSTVGMEFPNLELIRSFTGSPSEAGFILVHVTMVSKTGPLVAATNKVLKAAEAKNIKQLELSMRAFMNVMQKINDEMETMWTRSDPDHYKEFRTFIMGIKNQPMFPNGVIYDGVSSEPQAYRGESGANDSIIPTADNLFQLFERMPPNPLTEILADFRTYRPSEHAAWVSYVEAQAKRVNVRDVALSTPNSAVVYLANLDQIRQFRQRHWNFTKQYILKHTSHPVATGGSPIATWLPNQLSTVLSQMEQVASMVDRDKLTPINHRLYRNILKRMDSQLSILQREVNFYQKAVASGY